MMTSVGGLSTSWCLDVLLACVTVATHFSASHLSQLLRETLRKGSESMLSTMTYNHPEVDRI